MHRRVFIVLFMGIALFVASTFSAYATSISHRLAGQILLQVEQNGEAWYVHPETHIRHYLGRPADAFRVMRTQGLGITNADLEKIPIAWKNSCFAPMAVAKNNGGYSSMTCDSDDGEPGDYFALQDDIDNRDDALIDRVKGKILLQVEENGEAWYVNPVDRRRYSLGRPYEAFQIMRDLGLGITNGDLRTIPLTREYRSFPNKTVYMTDEGIRPIIDLDCALQGGVINTCGGMCGPSAEVCPTVCVLTCDFPIPGITM